jgi:hypothetical protein
VSDTLADLMLKNLSEVFGERNSERRMADARAKYHLGRDKVVLRHETPPLYVRRLIVHQLLLGSKYLESLHISSEAVCRVRSMSISGVSRSLFVLDPPPPYGGTGFATRHD